MNCYGGLDIRDVHVKNLLGSFALHEITTVDVVVQLRSRLGKGMKGSNAHPTHAGSKFLDVTICLQVELRDGKHRRKFSGNKHQGSILQLINIELIEGGQVEASREGGVCGHGRPPCRREPV